MAVETKLTESVLESLPVRVIFGDEPPEAGRVYVVFVFAAPLEAAVRRPFWSTVMLLFVYEPGVTAVSSNEITGVLPPDEAIGAVAVTPVTEPNGVVCSAPEPSIYWAVVPLAVRVMSPEPVIGELVTVKAAGATIPTLVTVPPPPGTLQVPSPSSHNPAVPDLGT